MERKRKLPARAAARVEQIAKRRQGKAGAPLPRHSSRRSETPATPPDPDPEPAPVEESPPPPPLPKSITAGKPLPTIDTPQPEDLSSKDYQSVSESGVLAESLTRSRQKWISESIFEKYWSKPTKRKGVVIEEPNNPPKDSMTKLCQVTITVEPHVLEATMFAVKDPKAPPPPTPSTTRPIIQYGPPDGIMPPPPPPPPTPKLSPPTTTTTPTTAPAQLSTQLSTAAAAQAQPQTPALTPVQTPTQQQSIVPQIQAPPPPPPPAQDASRMTTPATAVTTPTTVVTTPRTPMASPRGMESVLNTVVPQHVPKPAMAMPQPPPRPSPSLNMANAATTSTATPSAHLAAPPKPKGENPGPTTVAGSSAPGAAPGAAPGTKTGPDPDPIILTLAEKAGEDPQLRDLMKRVAQGDATKLELERFQAIIDAISAESKRGVKPATLSADGLLVDGRTVRYFADEVRAILDIVLSSNPNQTSADLRPPAGSDQLVVALVKAALDDARTSEIVRRIASNKPLFSDAAELKVILDRLRWKLIKELERLQRKPVQTDQPATAIPAATATTPTATTPTTPAAAAAVATAGHKQPNGASHNGQTAGTPATTPVDTPKPTQQPPSQQALRSKGPPPAPKPEISAIVFEFAGGSGDRFLFPKFSILEQVQTPTGQQVMASFLIVRRGSKSEYPVADPELDYYQPVTIRLSAPAPASRHLDSLTRVVAPQEEVRRYMDDIMETMTRAEYILLAMRLPRGGDGRDGNGNLLEGGGSDEKDGGVINGTVTSQGEADATTTAAAASAASAAAVQKQQMGVLWGPTRPPKPEIRELPPRSKMYNSRLMDMDADDQYQSFVASVSRKEAKEA